MERVTHIDLERRQDEAEAHIRATMMKELCEVMGASGLPPIAVLRLAARAIGTIYREMADAHTGIGACQCGWRPQDAHDADLLTTALMAACRARAHEDLRVMQVAGSA